MDDGQTTQRFPRETRLGLFNNKIPPKKLEPGMTVNML